MLTMHQLYSPLQRATRLISSIDKEMIGDASIFTSNHITSFIIEHHLRKKEL